jgi:starvation-inducible DNA-binding protein
MAGITLNSTPIKLAVPTGLGDAAREAVTAALNPIIADTFVLYIKTKNFHWHLSGPHFRDYHLLFDEQSAELIAMVDVLAERVRKLGGTTIRSLEHIRSLQHLHDDNDLFVEAKDMLRRLWDDNKEFTARLRAAHQVCDEQNDVATASLLENFLDQTERRIWFLFESQAS